MRNSTDVLFLLISFLYYYCLAHGLGVNLLSQDKLTPVRYAGLLLPLEYRGGEAAKASIAPRATPISPIYRTKRKGTLPKVALTREASKNHYLHNMILMKNINCEVVLLPVLDHCNMLANAKVYARFLECLDSTDIVVITSPHAAMEFARVWQSGICKRTLKLATVGKKTSHILSQHGLSSSFSPSQENALSLGRELPKNLGVKVLYPSSSIAGNTLPDELAKRGFQVTRVDIYDTAGAEKWDRELLDKAKEIDIVTLTSPSAARAWVERAGRDFHAVTIGSTTYKAAKLLDFTSVTSAEKQSDSLTCLLEGVRKVLQHYSE